MIHTELKEIVVENTAEKPAREIVLQPAGAIAAAAAPLNIDALMTTAVTANASMEILERLMTVRRELRAEAAKAAYDAALSAFQGECPKVQRVKAVHDKYGKLRYRYAPIDHICDAVRPFLTKHGFSYSMDAIVEDKFVTAKCDVSHTAGHTRTFNFKVPIDFDAYMSQPQKFASALTFAKRYVFCNAFGVMTADDDDDNDSAHPANNERPAQTPGPGQKTRPQASTAQTRADSARPVAGKQPAPAQKADPLAAPIETEGGHEPELEPAAAGAATGPGGPLEFVGEIKAVKVPQKKGQPIILSGIEDSTKDHEGGAIELKLWPHRQKALVKQFLKYWNKPQNHRMFVMCYTHEETKGDKGVVFRNNNILSIEPF